jgi:hypothetical protein
MRESGDFQQQSEITEKTSHFADKKSHRNVRTRDARVDRFGRSDTEIFVKYSRNSIPVLWILNDSFPDLVSALKLAE